MRLWRGKQVARLRRDARRCGRAATHVALLFRLAAVRAIKVGQLKLGVTVLAVGTLRAEALQVERARLPPVVLEPASRAELAKAAVVKDALVRALVNGAVGEDAILARTFAVRGVHVADWHSRRIIHVQKVAPVALHAEAAQPVLAHLLCQARVPKVLKGWVHNR